MLFEKGKTIFKINEPVTVQNISDPGFDKFSLFSRLGTSEIKLLDNFPKGTCFTYVYSSSGKRTVTLVGEKYIVGTTYISEDSIILDVGYEPNQILFYNTRADQEYNGNYVVKGITFQISLIEATGSSDPKTYIWDYAGAITYNGVSANPQLLGFTSIGFKLLGVTVTNIFGQKYSNIGMNCIDTPVMRINANPNFGIVRTGQALTLSPQLIVENGHKKRDINYSWLINNVQYNTESITFNFSDGITLGVTLNYSSLILTGLSGSTFGEYYVREIPGVYNIYVSGNTGNDAWTGENPVVVGTTGPVKTLQRAAQIARGYTGLLDININVAHGIYRLTSQSFYLTGGDSGINKTITYKPYASDKVVFSGGYTLSPSSFSVVTSSTPSIYNRLKTSARGNVYEADLSSMGISFGITLPTYWNGKAVENRYLPSIPDLFFDDQKMTVARWPNKSTSNGDTADPFGYTAMAYIDSVVKTGSSSSNPPLGVTNGVFKYQSAVSSIIERWTPTGASQGIWLHGFWKWDWEDEVYQIKSINTATREIEVYSSNGLYGIAKNNPCSSTGNPFVYANPTNRRWFAFNLLEELDAPGEYFLDRPNKKLYFWPPSTIGSGSDIVLSSILLAGDQTWVPNTPQFNDSQLQQQSHLNTNAVNASLFKFFKLKNVTIDGFEFRHMSGSGIEMILCENVNIKNCKIYSPRKNGIMVVGGKNNTIDTCEVHYAGLDAIILTGGDRQNLIPANNILQNSKLIGFGRNACSSPQGVLLTGVGNKISGNIIANSGSRGIKVAGNDHIIEYNNFTNLISDQDDVGGIYLANNVSDRNTTIRYNFFNTVKSQLPGGSAYDNALPAGGCPNPPIKTQLSAAIYIDEYNSGTNIYSNVFYNCGSTLADNDGAVFINHGIDNDIKNNIIVDCKTGVAHFYSKISDWNTHPKALLSGSANIQTGALQQILNINNEPWYEDGSPNNVPGFIGTFSGRNYNPYSFFGSGYGYEGTWVSTLGLLNKVNISGITWTEKYPKLFGNEGYILYDSNNFTLFFNTDYRLRNYVSDNVFVNVLQDVKLVRSTGDSAFSQGAKYTTNSYSIFEDYSNLNFKLTENGLEKIRQTMPGFVDIPFEKIPTL